MPSDEPKPLESTDTELYEKTLFTQPDVAQLQSKELSTTEVEIDPLLEIPTDDEQVNTSSQIDDIEASGAIFQAVGVITGEVNLNSEGSSTVTIGRNQYPLFYIGRKQRVFQALKKEIETTGNRTQRLVVYPKAIHFPKKEQLHRIAFQLVGFDRGRFQEVVSEDLEDLEFKFSGLWQFIPVCQTPCISVFRNFSSERLEYIKQAEPAQKVKFMKSSHLPLLWKDAPVRPFRFNPKVPKQEQGHAVFVTLKAKFLPGRDVWGFVALLAPPQETAPRFLKASKQDKATVQQSAKKNKPNGLRPSKKDNVGGNAERRNPPPKPIPKKKPPLVEGETSQ
ncbi:hypothetical protein [Nostoc parmelioides]|uniref:Uncharacterized protein n=1 Tax=Nostoc parmelioides FACHB-3921 TaxID=2692909 RepID=A0ABR8BLZ5_9NOSO|nr:hypothetical protein [Nostoc parmelioides]MBD2254242.1 hypothetical protein [Nostoc parmelioides FACHB-3921]